MMFILGTCLGILIGMFIIALISIDEINERQSLIIASRKALKRAEAKIENLENNIEILVNNSNDKKLKELVYDYQSEN